MRYSQTRNQTCVSCIGRYMLNHRTTRKVHVPFILIGGDRWSSLSFTLESIYPRAPQITEYLEFFTEVEDPWILWDLFPTLWIQAFSLHFILLARSNQWNIINVMNQRGVLVRERQAKSLGSRLWKCWRIDMPRKDSGNVLLALSTGW